MYSYKNPTFVPIIAPEVIAIVVENNKMQTISLIIVVLIGLISCSTALVHYMKLEKGANGCIFEGTEIEVGGTVKDPNTCGVYVCQNKEGDSLIHYCQIPAPFQRCKELGISTVTDFPQCCWMCVNYITC